MSRSRRSRGRWLAAGALCAAVALVLLRPRDEAAARRPNVLLLVLDAFRADRLGVVGYPLPTTPRLDALAARGVVFRHAYSPATWTKPAMASLFTSVYPSEHGVQDFPGAAPGALVSLRLHESFETVAESLQASGYVTGAIANQVHLKRRLGFAQGFELWRHTRGLDGARVNELGLEMVDQLAARGQPFFLWLHYLDVHSPYDRTLLSTRGRFGPTAMSRPPPRARSAFAEWTANDVSPQDSAALAARYDEEVSYLDDTLGRLFDALAGRGLLDSTAIVVTADHGEGFNEHGRFHHGYEPYDEVAKVPLVVVGPPRLGWRPGFRDTPVSLLDLAPTLVALAGGEPIAAHRGESLLALLRGREAPGREVFLQTETVRALRRGALKLWLEQDRAPRLFDLAADPAEAADLAAGGCDPRCRELVARARAIERSLALPPHVEPETLDAEDRAALEALGYL